MQSAKVMHFFFHAITAEMTYLQKNGSIFLVFLQKTIDFD